MFHNFFFHSSLRHNRIYPNLKVAVVYLVLICLVMIDRNLAHRTAVMPPIFKTLKTVFGKV